MVECLALGGLAAGARRRFALLVVPVGAGPVLSAPQVEVCMTAPDATRASQAGYDALVAYSPGAGARLVVRRSWHRAAGCQLVPARRPTRRAIARLRLATNAWDRGVLATQSRSFRQAACDLKTCPTHCRLHQFRNDLMSFELIRSGLASMIGKAISPITN